MTGGLAGPAAQLFVDAPRSGLPVAALPAWGKPATIAQAHSSSQRAVATVDDPARVRFRKEAVTQTRPTYGAGR